MKSIELRLMTPSGDQLESIPLEGFGIAEEWEDSPGENNQDIIEKVEALYEALLTLLRERQAAPGRGCTWLKIALGEALLTADEMPGDVALEIIVRPCEEGEDDEFSDAE